VQPRGGASARAHVMQAMNSRGKKRVLVVDPDPVTRELVGDILHEEGCSLADAATGEEALRRAAAEGCDVVVADMSLPDMSCTSFLARIREACPEAPVILMWEGETGCEVGRAAELEAAGLVRKPEGIRSLAAVLEGVCGLR